MIRHTSAAVAQELMLAFADATGLSSDRPPKRYLWTDAFAVCNLLGIYRQTGEPVFREHALQLVNQVHHLLGRHRPDDPRQGWISGLDEREGEMHPTIGGLRIGKPFTERKATEPFDERLEWERDGQYYHYLTKWMHALYRVSQETEERMFHRWAVELAKTAHAHFIYRPDPTASGSARGELRMRWKMSIDLSYPLVPSQGQHDPLDGWITYQQLQAQTPGDESASLDLTREIQELAEICSGKSWLTNDSLGIGGLLTDAYRLSILQSTPAGENSGVISQLLRSAARGLESYLQSDPLEGPADYRLAFRELGLAIGLRAVEEMANELAHGAPFESEVKGLATFLPLADQIETFWRRPASQKADSWGSHLEINRVMLATSLAPDGFLQL